MRSNCTFHLVQNSGTHEIGLEIAGRLRAEQNHEEGDLLELAETAHLQGKEQLGRDVGHHLDLEVSLGIRWNHHHPR